MCLLCDGYSYEDVMADLDLRIRTHGWAVEMVGPHPTDLDLAEPDPNLPRNWAYTVGLSSEFGLPELVMTDVELDVACRTLNETARLMVDADASPEEAVATYGATLNSVHGCYIDAGLVNTYSRYHGTAPLAGDYLQVQPPDDWFCASHARRRTRLDRPGGLLKPNRAHRRAAARRVQRPNQ